MKRYFEIAGDAVGGVCVIALPFVLLIIGHGFGWN